MFQGKYLTSMDDLSDIFRVRRQIPGFWPGERDEMDAMAAYVLVRDELGLPIGCGRMYVAPNGAFHVDKIGVIPEKRHMFIGDIIAEMLLTRAKALGTPVIEAHVPDDLLSCAMVSARMKRAKTYVESLRTPCASEMAKFAWKANARTMMSPCVQATVRTASVNTDIVRAGRFFCPARFLLYSAMKSIFTVAFTLTFAACTSVGAPPAIEASSVAAFL